MALDDFIPQTSADSNSPAESIRQPADVLCQMACTQGVSNGNSLKRLGFFLVNVWLLIHLFAIVIGPASVEPSSPLAQNCFGLIAPYSQALFLDHSFRFFVPEPGASTLMAYKLDFPDGSSRTGRFPDRTIVPRLFYHRHFMLSEFLGNTDEEFQPFIERAFARNLCRETGAIRVTLIQVTHDTPSIEDVRNGMTLSDPSLTTETPLGTYTPEELRSPFVLPLKKPNDGVVWHDRRSDSSESLP